MSTRATRMPSVVAAITRYLNQFREDRSGNVSVIMAALLVPFVGTIGLGFEVSNWYLTKHAMQNAADAAAIAAASNRSGNYDLEARAVAAQYGFINGVNTVTVAVSNTAACPAGGTNCYSVSISKNIPLYLARVVGYNGNATIGSNAAMNVASAAIATNASAPATFCILALATSGAPGIDGNGSPNADMGGCDLMSNTSATCNGHDLKAGIGAAHTSSNGCGASQVTGVPVVGDPYATRATNIPVNSCASYPQEPPTKKDPDLPSSNRWTGSQSLSGNVQVCGDLRLDADTVIDAPAGAVLVINNGQLDTNGHSLTTTSGSALTVVFSGTTGSYTHAPTGGGTLDFAAPTTGPWSGIAMYQDPALSTGVDIAAAGNSPTWKISGLVYLPHSSVNFNGAVNKSSNGKSCFAMVVDNVTINGTASILETGGCAQAGLTLPTAPIAAGRGQLVY